MPAPKDNDPLLCPGSQSTDYVITNGWVVCNHCDRVLKPVKEGPSTQRGKNTLADGTYREDGWPLTRKHRVRSRTTASMDKTRDTLLAYGIAPVTFPAPTP